MKTIKIEIRQQNEEVQLYNVYVGYDDKPVQLHSMALSFDESQRLGFTIIRMNPDCMPKILVDKYL